MPLDVDRLAEAMLAGTQALIAKAVAPLAAENEGLAARNADLEARLAVVEAREMPPAIDPKAIISLQEGLAAAVAAIEAREEPDIAAAVQEAVSAAVAGLEPPVAPDVAPMVAEAVEAAVAALPRAQDGKDADPAEIEALRDELAAVKAAIPEQVTLPDPPDLSGFATKDDVAAVVASIPEAKDFSPEIEGMAARLDAIVIPDPLPGKNGAGFADARKNADGELILKRDDGETFNVGKVQGEDGFSLEDFTTEFDGERTVAFIFAKSGRTERHEFKFPVQIYRGVWQEKSYEAGDVVTWGGSQWSAQRDTTDKPETSDAWRLSVKRGRDGKDYRPPEDRDGPVRVGVPK